MISKWAIVSESAKIGKNVQIWHFSQIRENATIGDGTKIGKNVYIDSDVVIGKNCKIQNNANIYGKCIIEDGVFIGPGVVITNDKYPRAVDKDMNLKTEWKKGCVVIKKGAAIGANSVIITDITIGEWSMVGAGSVVTKNVEDNTLVAGNPARVIRKGGII